MGRPVSWYTKINAPYEALKFYEALAKAAEAGAFSECHVFDGARNKYGVPILLDPGSHRAVAGPSIIGAYLGLQRTGKRLCNTPGCINIFHYEVPAEKHSGYVDGQQVPPNTAPSLNDWVELVSYLREKNSITWPLSYEDVRLLVPVEDVSDEHLPQVYQKLPANWRKI